MEGDAVYHSRAWTQLRVRDATARRDAMREVLGMLGAGPLAAPEVARDAMLLALDDPDEMIRFAAVRALLVLGPVEVLAAALDHADARIRRAAMQTLRRQDVEQSAAVATAVRAALADPDRVVAARALGLIGGERWLADAVGRQQLVAMLDHGSQRERADAVDACRGLHLDVAHADVLRALRRTLRRPAFRSGVLRALESVEPRAVSRGLVDDVAAQLAADDLRVRFAAARTLASFGPRAGHVVPQVAAACRRLGDEWAWRAEGAGLAHTAIRLGCTAPWVIAALARSVGLGGYWEPLGMLEWLGPAATAAEPAIVACARAELAAPDPDAERMFVALAALVAVAPGGPDTAALRDAILDRVPAFAGGFVARVSAYASYGDDRAARADRVFRWLLSSPELAPFELGDAVLDTLEATAEPALLAALAAVQPRLDPAQYLGLTEAHVARLKRIAVRAALRR